MSSETLAVVRPIEPDAAPNSVYPTDGARPADTTVQSVDQTTRAADEAELHDLFDHLLDAWARGDGQTYGSLFTNEADYIAFDGSNRRGTQAIAAEHQQLFDTWLKGTRLVGTVESIRFLTSDVAVLRTTGGTIFPGQGDERGRRPSIQTLVAVKRAGTWRFEAFHNTRVVKRNKLQWILYGILSRIFDR